MLEAGLEVFRQMLNQYGERILLDEYLPKDGTYILAELEENGYRIVKCMDIRYDKKNKTIQGKEEGEAYRFICYLDYQSKLIDMNKPVDSKKQIHSNQYLAFAVKKEALKEKKVTKEVIEGYYSRLAFPEERYKGKNDQLLYRTVKETLGDPDRDAIAKIQSYIMEGNLWSGVDLDVKEYIKIFFIYPDRERTKQIYEQENERYMIPCIYNNNDFNVSGADGGILGLSNNNMGMNSKKPFLANRSRKTPVPYLLRQEEALFQNKMFEYWMALASKGKIHLYIHPDAEEPTMRAYTSQEEPTEMQYGYYVRLKKGKEVEIHHWDVITDYSNQLKQPFYLRKVMEIPQNVRGAMEISKKRKESAALLYQNPCTKLFQIKICVDTILFDDYLSANWDTDAADLSIRDTVVKRCLLESRDRLAAWFYCGDESGVRDIIEKITWDLIWHSMASGNLWNARNQFNLRISLMDYWNQNRRYESSMKQISEQLRSHLQSTEEWELESEQAFAYALGQAAMFLLSRSKASKLPSSMVNAVINVKNHEMARKKLKYLFLKYNYDIDFEKSKRLKSLMAHIMMYEPKGKLDQEMVLAGMADELLLYEKSEKSEEKENKE